MNNNKDNDRKYWYELVKPCGCASWFDKNDASGMKTSICGQHSIDNNNNNVQLDLQIDLVQRLEEGIKKDQVSFLHPYLKKRIVGRIEEWLTERIAIDTEPTRKDYKIANPYEFYFGYWIGKFEQGARD